ncbi:hypothetical protein BFJ71_g15828 [Fusarium oxysporum]|nr:hypothetical protein BFJ71_g15828 [Fusarium oxysporum]
MSSLRFDADAAEYRNLAEKVTSDIATAALRHISPFKSDMRVLDAACGTGAATIAITDLARQQSLPSPSVVGIDVAEGMVKTYQAKFGSEAWPTVSSMVQDAQKMEAFGEALFDLVFMNFGLMHVPDGVACMKEIYRVLRPGGRALVTTWKSAGVAKIAQGAARALGVDYVTSPIKDGWDTKERLLSVVEAGGFRTENVKVAIEQTTIEKGDGEGIVKSMSSSFWRPSVEDWRAEDKQRWTAAVRAQLTPEQRRTGSVSMVAWICVAKKD